MHDDTGEVATGADVCECDAAPYLFQIGRSPGLDAGIEELLEWIGELEFLLERTAERNDALRDKMFVLANKIENITARLEELQEEVLDITEFLEIDEC